MMSHFSFSLYTEKLSATLALLWGIWVLLFQSGRTVVAYQGLAQYIPLWVIALFFIVGGTALFLFPLWHIPRHRVHMVLFAGWLVISLAFFTNDWANTGGVIYLIVALHHAGGYWQLYGLYKAGYRM